MGLEFWTPAIAAEVRVSQNMATQKVEDFRV